MVKGDVVVNKVDMEASTFTVQCLLDGCETNALAWCCYCKKHRDRIRKSLCTPLPWSSCIRPDGTDWLALPWELLQMILESVYSAKDWLHLVLSCKGFAYIVTPRVVARMRSRLIMPKLVQLEMGSVDILYTVSVLQDGSFHGSYTEWTCMETETVLNKRLGLYKGKLHGEGRLYSRRHHGGGRNVLRCIKTWKMGVQHGPERLIVDMYNGGWGTNRYHVDGRVVRTVRLNPRTDNHKLRYRHTAVDDYTVREEVYQGDTLIGLGMLKRTSKGWREAGVWRYWTEKGGKKDKLIHR